MVRAELAQRPPVPDGTVEIAVYFTDGPENLYQIDQWFEPLRRLHERHHVTVLSRNWETTRELLRRLARCRCTTRPTSTRSRRSSRRQRIRAILYVNQNQANFAAMRFADPAHVFICHGESDKDYMSSNQLKAYDRVFIAGTAARERIMRKLIGFDEPRLVEVGRPQVDVDFPGPTLPRDGRTVVLFAPTWEGDRASMRYSLGRLARPGDGARRSSRPGGTGWSTGRTRAPASRCARRRAAHADIVKVLRDANSADPTAGHVVDVEGGVRLAARGLRRRGHGHLRRRLRLAGHRQAPARHPSRRAAGRSCPSRGWCAS